ncbi:MAG TPA: ABC transporter permease [Dehalococcoidales bacterium]|nr:ABC transporter permease [Dehalococcoidales bacterium]
MKLIEFFSIAIRALLSSKLRSALTMLGMIIGVGAVIVLMSVGQGLQNYITSTFEEMGSNLLFVTPANPDAPEITAMAPGMATASLTMDDAEAMRDIRSVIAVNPTNENFVKLVAGNESASVVIEGTTPEFQQLYDFEIASGRYISEIDIARRDVVVVLGSKTAEDLFGSDDAVGQHVKMRDKRFTVIGVLEPKGVSSFGFSWDEMVITPITTFQARLFPQTTPSGEDAVQSIVVQAASAEVMDEVIEDIETLLEKRHRIDADEDNDFAVMSLEQMLGIFETITLALTVFLGLIGGISLLVGSIGIMNIMLVSVTERTREIGLRKAIGAKRRDILMQFLLEAAMLSLVGGAIGLTGAWLVAWGISQIDLGGFQINAVVSPLIVTVAVFVSVFIGLASGVYPAMRAARLNPIDALHYG